MIEQEKNRFFNLSNLLTWTIATSIGLTISDGLLASFAPPSSPLNILIPGIIVGASQWLFFLRSKSKNGGFWVFITALAWIIGLFFGRYVGIYANLFSGVIQGTLSEGDAVGIDSGILGLPILVIFHSLVLGVFQWLFFMRNRFIGAGWWIPTTVVGWSISIFIGWGIIPFIAQLIGWNESGMEDSAIRGVIFGLITGLVIQWLVEHPISNKEEITNPVENIINS